MAKVQRVGLLSREIVERMSIAGAEMLLSMAAKLSEGQLTGDHYYGSTMLTIDLRQLSGRIRDATDVATALRISRLIADSPAVIERIQQLAEQEAQRLAKTTLRCETDVRVRADGSWIFIDVDVSAMCALQGEEPTPEAVRSG